VDKEKEIDYMPRPKQAAFHTSKASECLFGGAKSPGKSCALTMEAVQYAIDYPGSTPYLFRQTYDDLEANLIQEFLRRVPAVLYKYDATRHDARMFNGSVIKFRYISNSRDAFNYQGRSIPWIGVDELTQHTEEAIQVLLSCNRSAEGFPVRFRATANPGGIGHQWVKSRYIVPTESGKHPYTDNSTGNIVQFIPATVYDGVLVEKDPAYVKRLENLPETEKQAYLYGNWDIFEGQFFSEFNDLNIEKPFELPRDCQSRLFGSLDHGITHNTSFGLWYVDSSAHLHRLFSYSANGGTAGGHAAAIWDMIESFPYTRGLFPSEIYFDPSIATKEKLSDRFFRSILDEYTDIFEAKEHSRSVAFLPANNRKIDGCHLMRAALAPTDGQPLLTYFDRYNSESVLRVKGVLVDKNNPEIYAKMDGDDEADEWRYGVVAGVTKAANLRANANRKEASFLLEDNKLEMGYALA